MSWSTKAPDEAGRYWFYGDPWFGAMGSDYTNPQVDAQLYLVEVIKISNGIVALAKNNMMQLRQFDLNKTKEGYCGYWRKADLPELPEWKLSIPLESES